MNTEISEAARRQVRDHSFLLSPETHERSHAVFDNTANG